MVTRKRGVVVLTLTWLFYLTFPANAQNANSAILSPPDIGGFPIIQTFLKAYDEQGNFLHQLEKADVTIREDGKSIPVLEIEELEPGVQFVVALNLGPTFAIRDSLGISRYQTIQASLWNWATSHSGTLDDLSFLTNDGPDVIHLDNARQWLSEFENYETNPRDVVPSLDVLVRAINIAADPTDRIGMGRAVLLLTPPPDRAGTAALQSIISIAKQNEVHVYIWMVSSPAYFSSEGSQQLAALANQTGGEFLTFSGKETLPEIHNYLENLRFIYTLKYKSEIRNNEPHQISARIAKNGLSIDSDNQDFDLEILPPNPIFLSPPIQIVRANHTPINQTFTEDPDYTPKEQTIKILIEFPDGRPRDIQRSTLYVDGEIADENISQPFDTFRWDLSEYQISSSHLIQAEVLDSYGLKNNSVETPIQITIQQTPQSILVTLNQNAPIIAGAIAAFAGGILLLVLVLSKRIQPRSFSRRKKITRQREQNQDKDTITKPVPDSTDQNPRRITSWINRLSWPHRNISNIQYPAYLEPDEGFQNAPSRTKIPITPGEITFGRDPTLSTITLDDSAVEGLHARLKIEDDEDVTIFDEGSIAGTWVNF